MPRLFRVILPVKDIVAAVRFYRAALQIDGTRVSPGRHYFDCEGTVLACYDPLADGDDVIARPIPEPVYFAVDDLDDAYHRVARAGATFPLEPVPGVGVPGEVAGRPWGERSFYAADPFGNPLCFVSRASMFTG
jgi:catechol 2,3-dioxygenase-like lactoylglutathione lyase family enzyme